MKKVVMLSAVVILSFTGMTISQAEENKSATNAKKADMPADPPHIQAIIQKYPSLINRIRTQGRVCFEGQECDITIAATLGAADPNNPREGKMIYDGLCYTCHATGLIGSPKLGDKAAWSARLAQGKETLYKHAIEGFNAMPAKGGRADLLDEEVKNAVNYILENSQ